MKFLIDAIFYQPIYNLLILLAWMMPGNSIGWAIIIITVILRLALLPSSLKQARSQMHMQELQPRINKIKKEITDTAEQSKAIMALYKEEGVSPFGACLPLLIQLPFMIALYSAMRHGLNTSGYDMLYPFIPRPETLGTNFLGFNLIVADPWILPIIAAGLQMLLSYLMMPKIKKEDIDPKDFSQAMGKQMIFLPAIMTLFIGRTLPAALAIYWIVTTLFGLIQQIYIIRTMKKRNVTGLVDRPVKIEPSVKKIEAPTKKGVVEKIMENRMAKKEKKAGVSVTIREKKK